MISRWYCLVPPQSHFMSHRSLFLIPCVFACFIFTCLATGTAQPSREGFLLSQGLPMLLASVEIPTPACSPQHPSVLPGTPKPSGVLEGLEQKPGFPQGVTPAHGERRCIFTFIYLYMYLYIYEIYKYTKMDKLNKYAFFIFKSKSVFRQRLTFSGIFWE